MAIAEPRIDASAFWDELLKDVELSSENIGSQSSVSIHGDDEFADVEIVLTGIKSRDVWALWKKHQLPVPTPRRKRMGEM